MPKEQVLEVTHYKMPPPPKPVVQPKPIVAPAPPKPVVVQPPELKKPEPPKIAEVKLPDIDRSKPTPVTSERATFGSSAESTRGQDRHVLDGKLGYSNDQSAAAESPNRRIRRPERN